MVMKFKALKLSPLFSKHVAVSFIVVFFSTFSLGEDLFDAIHGLRRIKLSMSVQTHKDSTIKNEFANIITEVFAMLLWSENPNKKNMSKHCIIL